MIYRFTLISDEVDDFIREIKIDSEATFFDSVSYTHLTLPTSDLV